MSGLTLAARFARLEEKIDLLLAASGLAEGSNSAPFKSSIKVEEIAQLVAWRWKIPVAEIISHSRLSTLVRPRAAVVMVARRVTDRSYPMIGAALGDRDHTTIINLHERAKDFELDDWDYRRRIQSVIEEIARKEKP